MMPAGLVSAIQEQLPRDGATLSARIHHLFDGLPSTGSAIAVALVARPHQLVRLVRLLAALPRYRFAPSQTVEGRVLRWGLARRSAIGRLLIGGATSALPIPADAGQYLAGGSRRTLRKKCNAAERAGVTVRAVLADERPSVLHRADDLERNHPDERYRTEDAENRGLLDLPRWRVAVDAEGEPLVLAVLAVDGEWAFLRYFRLVRVDPTASAARFLLMAELVRELSGEGVRFLVTDMSPIRMPSGLREFQHQVGFELIRVRPA